MLIKQQTLEQVYQASGVIGVSMILFYCLVQVFNPRIREGVLGCACYLVIATSCIFWLFHMINGTYPHRTTITMICGIAVDLTRRMMLLSPAWARFRCWWFMQVKHARAINESRKSK